MEIKESNRVKVNQFTIILSGLVLLTASCLVFLFIIKNVYGNFTISEILPSKKNLSDGGNARRIKAAVLYSRYTENFLPQGSTWLSDNINSWKTFLSSSKADYDIISDQAVELGQHFNYKVLILPGAKSLSDREVVQIKKFIENGGSVFATSGTSSFSDNGKWRGWEFFNEVFGLKFTRELKADEYTKIHTLRGGLPLTAGIPSGYPLKVATWDKPIACEVLEPRTTQVSFWYNFRRDSGLVGEEISKTAGIAYGTYGRGRFVWMGFELNSVLGKQEDYIFFGKLFQNSLNWLTYSPTVFVKDWPKNYEAAAVILPTLTTNIQNVYNILPILKSENVSATFFADPSLASENLKLFETLQAYGDVGGIIDIGYLTSVTDTVNKLYDLNTQILRARQARYNFSKVRKLDIKGAIPLYGLYDENTLQALVNQDYDYVFTDSLTDRAVPKTIIRGDKRIISFTKTARDDYEIIKGYGLTDRTFQIYTYEEDIDRLLFQRGLYVLKLHTDCQLMPQYAGIVQDLIKYLKSKKVWIASASEIRNWWLTKTHLEVNTDIRSKRRVAIEVSNPGGAAVHDVLVQINLNKEVKNLQISSDIFGTKIPMHYFDKSTQILTLKIDDIEPGGSYSYFIDFDNAGILNF
ncbi:MAG: hypothetical protein ACM3Q2_14020 [Syntrophothermus sp.]